MAALWGEKRNKVARKTTLDLQDYSTPPDPRHFADSDNRNTRSGCHN